MGEGSSPRQGSRTGRGPPSSTMEAPVGLPTSTVATTHLPGVIVATVMTKKPVTNDGPYPTVTVVLFSVVMILVVLSCAFYMWVFTFMFCMEVNRDETCPEAGYIDPC